MFSVKTLRYLLSGLLVALIFVPAIGQDVNNPGTLVVARISQPESLDPAWNFDTASNEVLKHMYMNLFEFEGASVDSFVPAIAVAVPTVANGGISADGLTYSIQIRDGLKFADGEDITAEDVEYSLERTMIIDRAGGPAFLLNDIMVFGVAFSSTRDGDGNLKSTVDSGPLEGTSLVDAISNSITVDGNTVTFHLVQPFPPFLQVLTGGTGSPIVDTEFVIASGGWPGFTGDAAADAENIAAYNNPDLGQETLFELGGGESGPFTLVNWDRTTGEVLLAANPNWVVPSDEWGAVFGERQLDNILFREVFENATRELGLQQGEIDVIDVQPAARLDEIKDTPGVRVYDQIPGLSYDSIHFNFNFQDSINDGTAVGVGSGQLDGAGVPGDFFQDADVRRGFAHAFDQQTVIDDVLNGRSTTAPTAVHPGLPFHDPSIEGIRFDLAAATESLQAAFNGAVWENGFSVDCIYNDGNVRRQVACEVLAANLNEINPAFVINPSPTPFSVFLGQIISGVMPLYSLGWSPDFVDAGNFMDQWMTTGGFYSGFNEIGRLTEFSEGGVVSLPGGGEVQYDNWDELLRLAFAEPDSGNRQALYTESQVKFVEATVAISLTNPTDFEVTRDSVGNIIRNGSLSASLLHGVFKEANAAPNCAEVNRVGGVTLDGSC